MRKKRGFDAEESKKQAGGTEKERRTAANMELEQGGRKDVFRSFCCYCVGEIVHLLRVFFNFKFYLSSCCFKCPNVPKKLGKWKN